MIARALAMLAAYRTHLILAAILAGGGYLWIQYQLDKSETRGVTRGLNMAFGQLGLEFTENWQEALNAYKLDRKALEEKAAALQLERESLDAQRARILADARATLATIKDEAKKTHVTINAIPASALDSTIRLELARLRPGTDTRTPDGR